MYGERQHCAIAAPFSFPVVGMQLRRISSIPYERGVLVAAYIPRPRAATWHSSLVFRSYLMIL